MFGRGGEELAHLRAQGVDVEVVNGITAGLAGMTSLGVPLTHRAHAHGVLFVTGHAQRGGSAPDFALLGHTAQAARLTLVIYMGVSHAQEIAAALLQGLPADTPAAIIQNASLPSQRHALCTLASLCQTLALEQLGSPSVMVVGDVLQGALALAQAQPQSLRKTA
jgi:uroporphyrin-III C-methyltransferase